MSGWIARQEGERCHELDDFWHFWRCPTRIDRGADIPVCRQTGMSAPQTLAAVALTALLTPPKLQAKGLPRKGPSPNSAASACFGAGSMSKPETEPHSGGGNGSEPRLS